MPTAFQHRPMSKILAPAPEAVAQGQAKPAPAALQEAKPIPDKYVGKSVEDVIEMHRNAESALGRANSEVGNLRGLVTDLSSLRSVAPPVTVVPEPVTLSSEELLSDPVSAISRIVQPHFDELKSSREKETIESQIRNESAAIMRDFGDIDSIVQTEEFLTFANRTAGRQADFNTAANGEGLNQTRAARRLLEDFADFTASTTPPKTATPVERARAVATEGANTGAPISTKAQLFESDVIALINSDPARYRSPSYQAEMMAAIREGRFVKNA
jgi:hypothetical protein